MSRHKQHALAKQMRLAARSGAAENWLESSAGVGTGPRTCFANARRGERVHGATSAQRGGRSRWPSACPTEMLRRWTSALRNPSRKLYIYNPYFNQVKELQ